jgi:hypothetical protein
VQAITATMYLLVSLLAGEYLRQINIKPVNDINSVGACENSAYLNKTATFYIRTDLCRFRCF